MVPDIGRDQGFFAVTAGRFVPTRRPFVPTRRGTPGARTERAEPDPASRPVWRAFRCQAR